MDWWSDLGQENFSNVRYFISRNAWTLSLATAYHTRRTDSKAADAISWPTTERLNIISTSMWGLFRLLWRRVCVSSRRCVFAMLLAIVMRLESSLSAWWEIGTSWRNRIEDEETMEDGNIDAEHRPEYKMAQYFLELVHDSKRWDFDWPLVSTEGTVSMSILIVCQVMWKVI